MSSSPITLFDRTLPPYAERTGHVLDVGDVAACGEAWREMLAVVEQGVIELRTGHGARLRLESGACLCLGHLTPLVLGNAGDTTAVVATVRRGSAAMTGRIADEQCHYPTQRP